MSVSGCQDKLGHKGLECPDGISDTQQCPFFVSRPPVSVRRQSFWREVAAELGGIAHQLSRDNGPAHAIVPRYCSCSKPTMPQPFESRGHITEADRSSTLRKHIVKARIPTCANVHGAYQVVHGTYRVMCCPLIDGRTTVWSDDTTDT